MRSCKIGVRSCKRFELDLMLSRKGGIWRDAVMPLAVVIEAGEGQKKMGACLSCLGLGKGEMAENLLGESDIHSPAQQRGKVSRLWLPMSRAEPTKSLNGAVGCGAQSASCDPSCRRKVGT